MSGDLIKNDPAAIRLAAGVHRWERILRRAHAAAVSEDALRDQLRAIVQSRRTTINGKVTELVTLINERERGR